MNNLMSFIALTTLLFFASCTKEALQTPEPNTIDQVAERSTTIELPVARVSSSEESGEYIVDFTSDYDFTEEVLEPTQYLDFTDANGNLSTLTFEVNSFSGSNGSLNAVFAIGANSLTGLSLAEVQEIIIDDVIIE